MIYLIFGWGFKFCTIFVLQQRQFKSVTGIQKSMLTQNKYCTILIIKSKLKPFKDNMYKKTKLLNFFLMAPS